MPSSYPENIPTIIHMIAQLKPKTVLDVGVGNGKYGFLLREYFGPTQKGDWQPIDRIDGLEIFPGYLHDIQYLCYDEMFIQNALTFKYPQYDVYLLIDVIEHWPKEEGHRILEDLTKKGIVIVSTPNNIGDQGATNDNEWERHVSQWLPPDFQKYNIKMCRNNDWSFIYALGK